MLNSLTRFADLSTPVEHHSLGTNLRPRLQHKSNVVALEVPRTILTIGEFAFRPTFELTLLTVKLGSITAFEQCHFFHSSFRLIAVTVILLVVVVIHPHPIAFGAIQFLTLLREDLSLATSADHVVHVPRHAIVFESFQIQVAQVVVVAVVWICGTKSPLDNSIRHRPALTHPESIPPMNTGSHCGSPLDPRPALLSSVHRNHRSSHNTEHPVDSL